MREGGSRSASGEGVRECRSEGVREGATHRPSAPTRFPLDSMSSCCTWAGKRRRAWA